MDPRAQEFRRGAARLKTTTTGRRYPEELRELAVAYTREHVAEGRTLCSAATDLGVPAQTLTYWVNKTSGSSSLVRVQIEATEAPRPAAEILVRLPCGTVISGVTVAEAVMVVRGLR